MTRAAHPLPVLRALPRRVVSRAVGALARAPLPRLVLTPLLALYARAYGVALDEAERPLGAYSSFTDFFTRALRSGARTLPADARAIASPCDGRVHVAGDVESGLLLQAKGMRYPLSELLGFPRAHEVFEGGTYLTVHLTPGDYHRFHWPFDAHVEELRTIPGDLWPVHRKATAGIAGVFVRNARVVLLGRTPTGGRFAVVAVGALNVGSIRIKDQPIRTNRGESAIPRCTRLAATTATRGDEMGHFELGSTIVLVLERRAGTLDALEPGTPLRVGQAIGRESAAPSVL